MKFVDITSPEERMASIIGPRAAEDEGARKKELKKRLNRVAVIRRKEILEMTKRNNLFPSISTGISCNNNEFGQATTQHVAMATYNGSLKENSTNVCLKQEPGYGNCAEATSKSATENGYKWVLRPVDLGNAIKPFSWRHIVEKWRSEQHLREEVDMEQSDEEDPKLQEFPKPDTSKEREFRPTTPPRPKISRKRKSKSNKNCSKLTQKQMKTEPH